LGEIDEDLESARLDRLNLAILSQMARNSLTHYESCKGVRIERCLLRLGHGGSDGARGGRTVTRRLGLRGSVSHL